MVSYNALICSILRLMGVAEPHCEILLDDGPTTRLLLVSLASSVLLLGVGLFMMSQSARNSSAKKIQTRGNDGTLEATRPLGQNNESSSEEVVLEDDIPNHNKTKQSIPNSDNSSDPGLLKKHSSYGSYTTHITTYQSIRTFFCPHPHIEKLPTHPSSLPLLVFVHGLGGSLAQFHPLLTTLTNVAPCFGIDFPGCGLSNFSPTEWSAYSLEALTTLLATAIEKRRDTARGQNVILIGHSLGCSVAALLASTHSSIAPELKKHIIGVVALCPQSSPPSKATTAQFRRLLHIPELIFNAWRRWDRRGGPNSHSVSRYVGSGADIDTRKLQLRFNEQSRTPVWRRMAWGTLPVYDSSGIPNGGLPGASIWKGIQVPLLLIAGESDPITKPEEISKILAYFNIPTRHHQNGNNPSQSIPNSAHSLLEFPRSQDSDQSPSKQSDPYLRKKTAIRVFVFPAPASHALPYDRSSYRALSGLMQDFFCDIVDKRLSLGWQLQHLTTSGKWDVKNLAKWEAIAPVSDPIGETFFALKTLRELDKAHSPLPFVEKWKGKMHAIIDISHESPVYDTAQLGKHGIQYHKLPTVSKIPPTLDEVRDFVYLVDSLKEEISTQVKSHDAGALSQPLIGVHCHYGFNRTGFFVTSYLIERKGYLIDEALEEFKRCRPPGIRHSHFIDALFVRYRTGVRGRIAVMT
ncbi:hypothetical protein LOZ61_006182 [Ophidiomyces ophidiicola]|uniref:Uncharacterized protein n=1 Tax=Ophidiomyces ophidiicola TaxID=1387563 RepID=A0ACB8UQD8_9EURO|nr:hypothetical protein LOZ61_006182 [Ophidiomyces ophidiicola]KAI1908263.1 hypothetical protein LOZ64_005637 [Ophidiomyces ophidiicola]KAI1923185.1 hypothetical protein LOZ60_005382 [Ophidiomyces ophidiicola]KAI1951295.1 hypothetical protein LOZ59_005673 [Ophidiomyces ophidiicola]KAI1968676.1 hypothetical protein LOZ56_004890 [Ophidiomyces ophidiicola]